MPTTKRRYEKTVLYYKPPNLVNNQVFVDLPFGTLFVRNKKKVAPLQLSKTRYDNIFLKNTNLL